MAIDTNSNLVALVALPRPLAVALRGAAEALDAAKAAYDAYHNDPGREGAATNRGLSAALTGAREGLAVALAPAARHFVDAGAFEPLASLIEAGPRPVAGAWKLVRDREGGQVLYHARRAVASRGPDSDDAWGRHDPALAEANRRVRRAEAQRTAQEREALLVLERAEMATVMAGGPCPWSFVPGQHGGRFTRPLAAREYCEALAEAPPGAGVSVQHAYDPEGEWREVWTRTQSARGPLAPWPGAVEALDACFAWKHAAWRLAAEVLATAAEGRERHAACVAACEVAGEGFAAEAVGFFGEAEPYGLDAETVGRVVRDPARWVRAEKVPRGSAADPHGAGRSAWPSAETPTVTVYRHRATGVADAAVQAAAHAVEAYRTATAAARASEAAANAARRGDWAAVARHNEEARRLLG